MTDKTTVTPIATESDDALYCHYQGQTERQPALLCLDLETGELSAHYSSIIGSGQSMRAFYGRDIEWEIPPLRMAPLADLMRKVTPACQAILDSATVDWDGSNRVGRLSYVAREAAEDVYGTVEGLQPEPYEVYEPWAACDYYEPVSDVLAELGLTAYSTDAEIESEAKRAVEDAEVVLDQDDVESYLRQLRDDERYELDVTAEGEELEGAREDAINHFDFAQAMLIDRAIDGDEEALESVMCQLCRYAILDAQDMVTEIVLLHCDTDDSALRALYPDTTPDRIVALPFGDVGDRVSVDVDGVATVVDDED